MSKRIMIDCDELRRLYEVEHLGIVVLAQRYQCSPTTISTWLHKCGVTVRNSRFQPIRISADVLRQLYEVEHLPTKEIAQRLGISISTLGNYRRAFGIPLRQRKGSSTK